MKPKQNKMAIAVNVSKNAKTGLTAATYASRASCPQDCPLWEECYAKFGHVGLVTNRLDRAVKESAADALQVAQEEAQAIGRLDSGLPLRLHVVGDCRTNRAAQIVSKAAMKYQKEHQTPVWTYTHAHQKVKRSSWGSVSVLASCESTQQAKRVMQKGYAAAIVVAKHESAKAWKDKETGLRVIPCPSQVGDTTCVKCQLCFDDTKLLATNSVIGFEAHGVKKNQLLNVLQANG